MVYKNGIPYDISYQVTDKDCPEPPNGIEKVNDTSSFDVKFKVDSSWLPYFTVTDAEIKIGKRWSGKDYNNTVFWNTIQELWFEATDLPVNIAGEMMGMEQLYIYNNARWGQMSGTANTGVFNGCNYVTIKDNNNDVSYGTYYFPNAKETYCLWVPNGTAITHCEGTSNFNIKNIVYCAKNITVSNNENSSADSTIYYNDDAILSSTFEDANFTGTIIPFAKDETEWLENYFNITQNGQTLPWNTSNIENYFGKYIRLRNNNNIVGEILYWKLDTITTEIEQNLTDYPVTRTGTVTYGSLSQNYSITLDPVNISVKARLYFNTESGTYSLFSVWPYRYDIWVGNIEEMGEEEYNRWTTALKSIKLLKYKPVESSTWTTYTIPTPEQLLDDRGNWQEYVNLSDMISLNIDNDGYYDVEWVIDYAQVFSVISGENYQFMLRNKKISSDKQSRSENADTQDANHPYEISCTYHNDYLYCGRMNWWDQGIYNTIFNNLSDATCYTRTGVLKDFVVEWSPFGGWESNTYLKDVVYENCTGNTEVRGLIYVENDEFSTDGTLWYASSARIPFNETPICGVQPAPHTIYLHPTIYAMTNHGFDDTVRGWESSVLDDFINNGGTLLELPTNWRELVPNYIG